MTTTDLEMLEASRRAIVRTAEDADEDYQTLIKDVRAADFHDWPNEAGFDNLTEIRGPVELPVQGSIPAWAAGILYRTGPGTRTIEDTPTGTFKVSHWFDGFAQSHKFDISTDDNGKVHVHYCSRHQSQEIVDRIRQFGWRNHFSFGQKTDPCLGLFAKVMSVYNQPRPERKMNNDNICVAVLSDVPGLKSKAEERRNLGGGDSTAFGHQPRPRNVWLTTDTNSIKEINAATLEPIGFATQRDLHPSLVGTLSCSHAQRDPETGDMFNYNLELGATATYRIFRVNACDGSTDILATVSLPSFRAAYIHSFFLSPDFVILCCPSTHLYMNGLKLVWQRNIIETIEPMTKDKKMQWLVVDRRHGAGVVARFESDAAFFFHSINTFQVPVTTASAAKSSANSKPDQEAALKAASVAARCRPATADNDNGSGRVNKNTGDDEASRPSVAGQSVVDANDGEEVDIFCDCFQYANMDILNALEYAVAANDDGAGCDFWRDPQRSADSLGSLVRYRMRVRLPTRTPTLSPPPATSLPSSTPTQTPKRTPSSSPSSHSSQSSWVVVDSPTGGAVAPPPEKKPVIGSEVKQTTKQLLALPVKPAERVFSVPAPHAGELPTINPRRKGQRHRYVYSVVTRGKSPFLDGLAKLDLDTREVLWWNNGTAHTPGEAIFVPRPGGTDEDDGVLLSVVLDGYAGTSYLVCIDAQSMQEIGRAVCNWAVGHGFHGLHV